MVLIWLQELWNQGSIKGQKMPFLKGQKVSDLFWWLMNFSMNFSIGDELFHRLMNFSIKVHGKVHGKVHHLWKSSSPMEKFMEKFNMSNVFWQHVNQGYQNRLDWLFNVEADDMLIA
jgi:hypothetical protein